MSKATYCDLCDKRLPESKIDQHKHLMNDHTLQARLDALTSRDYREHEPA